MSEQRLVANLPEENPALARFHFSWRVAAGQWLANLVLVLLAVAWLQIPDSHVWQFVCSVVTGIALLAAFLWLQRETFARLLVREKKAPLWVSFLVCALLVLIWMGISLLIDMGRGEEYSYGSLWNSKLPHGMRAWFTFDRLVWLQDRAYDLMQIVAAALLAPVAVQGMGAGVSSGFLGRVLAVYRRWRYWLAAIVVGSAGWWLTGKLVDWTPGRTVWQQIASVAARLSVAYTVDILLGCLMLAAIARYLNSPKARRG